MSSGIDSRNLGSGYFDVPRETQLWFNLPNTVQSRAGWSIQKHARDIRQQRYVLQSLGPGFFNDGHVLFTGDAWILQPYGRNPAELLTEDRAADWVGSDSVLMASNHRVFNQFRKTTVPGAGIDASVVGTGAPAFQRRRAAGSLLSTGNLDDDAASMPSPQGYDLPALEPMDRVLSGTVNYPPDQPFLLEFWKRQGSMSFAMHFQFGGDTEVKPEGRSGGLYSLAFRGDGRAVMSEYDTVAAQWSPVWEFNYDPPSQPIGTDQIADKCSIYVIPYGRDRLLLYNIPLAVVDTAYDVGDALTLSNVIVADEWQKGIPRVLFKHDTRSASHIHQKWMTGSGVIRVDRARTNRSPFSIVAMKYRTPGSLIDAPVYFDVGVIPLASHLTVTVEGYAPDGTAITPTVYDGTTNVALLRSGPYWLTNENQNTYYVGFDLTSAGNPDASPPVAAGERTPVLEKYTLTLAPAFTTVEATPVKTARITDLNITGPGLSPVEEICVLNLKDEVNEAALLRGRDQMRFKVVLCNRATGAPLSVLFEGRTASPKARLRGNADGAAYPSALWHDYDFVGAGMWPSLFRQWHTGPPFDFSSSQGSPNPAPDPQRAGAFLTWRLTDSLRWAFNHAGVPDSQLDIPNLPYRWPQSGSLDPANLSVLPGTRYGSLVEFIAKEFLGDLVLRDPNCGASDSTGLPSGMWRLLLNPALDSTNYLFTISLDLPPVTSSIIFPMAEGAHGTEVYPVKKDSWDSWPKAAECNVVVCRAFANSGTDNGSKMLQSKPLVNQAGFDPTSPHWLEGDTVIVAKVFEGFAMTQEDLNAAARLLYKRAAFAEKWWECLIPCPLLFDPQDVPSPQVLPRPPRVNDLCLIRYQGNDYPAVIRSANPIWDKDDWPWLHIEGKFRDTAYTFGA